MKTFLFPTDFSKSAHKAANFAAQLASKQNARLVLFNSYHFIIPNDSDYSVILDSIEFLEKISQRKLTNLKKRLHQKVDKNLEIITILKQGFVKDTIKELIPELKVDLLLMCISGNTPSGANYFGSLAIEMVNKVKIPLLLLPAKSKIANIENVVLSVDLSLPIDAIALAKGLHLLRELNIILNVIYVAETAKIAQSKSVAEASLMIRELLGKIPHTFQSIVGENPVKEIIKFLRENKAQMLMTLPKHHNFFEKLFVESNTHQLAFGADVPVLVVS